MDEPNRACDVRQRGIEPGRVGRPPQGLREVGERVGGWALDGRAQDLPDALRTVTTAAQEFAGKRDDAPDGLFALHYSLGALRTRRSGLHILNRTGRTRGSAEHEHRTIDTEVNAMRVDRGTRAHRCLRDLGENQHARFQGKVDTPEADFADQILEPDPWGDRFDDVVSAIDLSVIHDRGKVMTILSSRPDEQFLPPRGDRARGPVGGDHQLTETPISQPHLISPHAAVFVLDLVNDPEVARHPADETAIRIIDERSCHLDFADIEGLARSKNDRCVHMRLSRPPAPLRSAEIDQDQALSADEDPRVIESDTIVIENEVTRGIPPDLDVTLVGFVDLLPSPGGRSHAEADQHHASILLP